MSDFVSDKFDLQQVGLVLEDAVLDGPNGVVGERDLLEADRKGQLVQALDQVRARVQGLEVEPALEVVVVAKFFDLVVVDVQPFEAHWDEGVVEPQETVGGHVKPLQAGQGGDEPVDVRQQVVVQSQSPQVFQVLERSLLNLGQFVVGEVEDVNGGSVGEVSSLDG